MTVYGEKTSPAADVSPAVPGGRIEVDWVPASPVPQQIADAEATQAVVTQARGLADHGTPPSPPVAPPPPVGPPATAVPANRRRRALVAGAVAAAVLVAAAGIAAWAYSPDVPRGTTVLGTDLGGLSRGDAVQALRAAITRQAGRFTEQVTVRVGPQTVRIKPDDVGLRVDVEATVDAAAAAEVGPPGRLFGSRTVEPVVTVDTARLAAALEPAATRAGRPAKQPAVVFDKLTPRPVYPRPGIGLEPAGTARVVRDGWLSGQPITVPLVEVHPATTAQDVDRLVSDLARPAVAGPVSVSTERGGFDIPPAAIAKALVLRADKAGKITPQVDVDKLRVALADRLAKVEIEPREATVRVSGGKPRVIASTGGRQVEPAAFGRDLLAVLPRPDGRQITAVLTTVEPKTTATELAALGIKERVSTFTTRFTGGRFSSRSQNIFRIADEVDGAVVKPGALFSLNGHTGERSYKQGYKDAPVIQGGKLVPGVGGGASQFTTTLFNAAYYAGMQDVEHKPHSYWFSRYPPVIESTIFYPTLDLKFRNTSPHGILIDTSHTGSSVTVSIWSTRVYDKITTKWSARRNITSPRTIHLKPGPRCIPTTGLIGFTQDAWRIFRKDGNEVKREKFSWRYAPEPRYVCAKKKKPV